MALSCQHITVLPVMALKVWGKSVIPNSRLKMQLTHQGLSDKTRKNSLSVGVAQKMSKPLRINFFIF
jgi:hypothetical protein